MDKHPFRTAFETRDLDLWIGEFAEDVVAHSPMFKAPLRGGQLLSDLYGALFAAFDNFDLIHEFRDGDLSAFFWRDEIRGRTIHGVDLIRKDGVGKICEITVFIRPLVALADFGAGVGPPFARRLGRFRALVAKLVAAPLQALFGLIEAMAVRIVLGRRAQK